MSPSFMQSAYELGIDKLWGGKKKKKSESNNWQYIYWIQIV